MSRLLNITAAFPLRPRTDHIEVLTDHIGILKYPNRQKVTIASFCEIESKSLFLWTIRIEPTLQRADFFSMKQLIEHG